MPRGTSHEPTPSPPLPGNGGNRFFGLIPRSSSSSMSQMESSTLWTISTTCAAVFMKVLVADRLHPQLFGRRLGPWVQLVIVYVKPGQSAHHVGFPVVLRVLGRRVGHDGTRWSPSDSRPDR